MKLRRIPEAFKAGWSAFRATLFLPQEKSMTFVGDYYPISAERSDIWVRTPSMELYIFTGRRWKKLTREESRIKRYLTRLKK